MIHYEPNKCDDCEKRFEEEEEEEEEDDDDDDDDEDDEDESIQLEVALDEEGRISGTSNIGLNFGFYDGDSCSIESSLLSDTDIMAALKDDVDAIFDGCSTFWLPGREFEPRTTLERLAKIIFDFHTETLTREGELSIDWEKSGAEYWTQKRVLGTSSTEGSIIKNDDTMIRFHFDKDEELVDQTDGEITVHPQISTVTYLTSGGSPTLVVPFCMSREKDEIKDDVSTHRETSALRDNVDDDIMALESIKSEADIHEICVSYPKEGKHISFDGRFLHGCPNTLSVEDAPDNVRKTFLVNIWINWKPLGPELFPEENLSLLSNLDINIRGLQPKKRQEKENVIHCNDYDHKTKCTAFYGPLGWDYILKFYLPVCDDMKTLISQKNLSSFCLKYSLDQPSQVGRTVRSSLKCIPPISPSDFDRCIRQFKIFHVLHFERPRTHFIKDKDDVISSVLNSLQLLQQKHPMDFSLCCSVSHGKKSVNSDVQSILDDVLGRVPGKKRKAISLRSGSDEQEWMIIFKVSAESSPELFSAVVEAFTAQIDSIVNIFPQIVSNPRLHIHLCMGQCAKNGGVSEVLKSHHSGPVSCFMQLCGSHTINIYPDEMQDWQAGPPPQASESDPISVDVNTGNVLLFSQKFWMHNITDSGTEENNFECFLAFD